MKLISLKTLCELVGVSRRSIQCYEKAGLMRSTSRNKYGHLLYDVEALHRAEEIKFLQQLGFKLREIREIIDAPCNVKKEVLKRRVSELEEESAKQDKIIQEAMEYIKGLRE